jgi:hypothetical protein
MKSRILLLVLFVTATMVYGQSKKEKEQAQKDQQAKIDTLTKHNASLKAANESLKHQQDSLKKEYDKYHKLYTVIEEKVVKKPFDPARMSAIIDSLKAGRDSLTLKAAALAAGGGSKKEIDSLRKETEGLLYTVNLLRGKPAKSPGSEKEFVGTWNLILRKVRISGDSPRAGIIDVSEEAPSKTAAALETNPITAITFIDHEFAEFTFKNGEKGKCYYVINEFSATHPYSIDFKGTKADIRMYFMNTQVGSRISFEIPNTKGTYYFGQMVQ